MSVKEQNRKYYLANKAKIAAKQKEWRESNPKRLAYAQQKDNASKRGIEFLFTFEQWLEFWGDDVILRGNSPDDLVMARRRDCGPYSPENCVKVSVSENSIDANRAPQDKRIA
jgi:hypothetical protein